MKIPVSTGVMPRLPLLAAVLSLAAAARAGINIVVAPDGLPGNAGTDASPLDIAGAQRRAREVAGTDAVTVALRAGRYELRSPLVFTAADSGTKDRPVVWTAAPDADVTLCTGRTLKPDWRQDGTGAFVTELPADIAPFDQLFADGRPMILARYPDYDPAAAYYGGYSEDSTSKERAARWAHPEGGYVHAMHAGMWGDFHYVITGKKPDGSLRLEGGTQNNRPEAGTHRKIRFVENIAEELDAPGEWFFDAATHKLRFIPPAGMIFPATVFTVPQGESVVRFAGDRDHPVRFVTLRGVKIRETFRTFMKVAEPMLRSDWCVYRGGAVYLKGAEDCAVTGCDLSDLGGNAVFADGYNARVTVADCLFLDDGASAVSFAGDTAAVRSPVFAYRTKYDPAKADRTPGPASENYPRDCRVSDCLVLRNGRIEKQTAGVTIDVAARITVSHCTIADVPRAGINIGEGAFGGHVIEGNDVFDTVKETGDHGCFNSWGRDRFWNPSTGSTSKFVLANPEFKFLDVVETNVIRGNRFRYDRSHGWAIDLDDGSSNYLIENNLCVGGGLKFREGYGRVARNNVLAYDTFHPHVWYEKSGDIFERNIVFRPYAPIGMGKVWGEKIDGNFLHVPGGATGAAAALQKSSRQDAHSLTGDALFVDPEHGDFRVKPGSPALKTGFVNFPMNAFGVTSPRLRRLAPAISFAPVSRAVSARPDATTTFLGATVKNIKGIGELSAAGMSEEKGVLVVSLPAGSALAKLGVKERDVILAWNDRATDTVEALKKAAKENPAPAKLVVRRNQANMTL